MSVIVLSTDKLYELHSINQERFSWLAVEYLRHLCCCNILPVEYFPVTRKLAVTLGEEVLQKQLTTGMLGSFAFTQSANGVRLIASSQATVKLNKQSVTVQQQLLHWAQLPTSKHEENNIHVRLFHSLFLQLVRLHLRGLRDDNPVVRKTARSRVYRVHLLQENRPCTYIEVEDTDGIVSTKVCR